MGDETSGAFAFIHLSFVKTHMGCGGVGIHFVGYAPPDLYPLKHVFGFYLAVCNS